MGTLISNRIQVITFDQSPLSTAGTIMVNVLKRFSDEINNNQDTLVLDDLRYVPIGSTSLIGQAATGMIRKTNIVLITREPESQMEKESRPFKARPSDRQLVTIHAGNWLVTGRITLPPKHLMEQVIVPPPTGFRFLPVTMAVAEYLPNLELVVKTGEVLLVNRAYITSIAIDSTGASPSNNGWFDGNVSAPVK